MREVADNTFLEEINGTEAPVVVDFWAPWCGPCKMISPIVEELDAELGGKAKFIKVNVDENPQVSQRYRIASIPTIMVFKNGEPVDNLVGFRPKQALKEIIEKHI